MCGEGGDLQICRLAIQAPCSSLSNIQTSPRMLHIHTHDSNMREGGGKEGRKKRERSDWGEEGKMRDREKDVLTPSLESK